MHRPSHSPWQPYNDTTSHYPPRKLVSYRLQQLSLSCRFGFSPYFGSHEPYKHWTT
jgi:hypothetical protein